MAEVIVSPVPTKGNWLLASAWPRLNYYRQLGRNQPLGAVSPWDFSKLWECFVIPGEQ